MFSGGGITHAQLKVDFGQAGTPVEAGFDA